MSSLATGHGQRMNVSVGTLNHNTTEDSLRRFFEPYGIVISARIITDRRVGRSTGFVEMNDEDARTAILELDGRELDGRRVRVGEAGPRAR